MPADNLAQRLAQAFQAENPGSPQHDQTQPKPHQSSEKRDNQTKSPHDNPTPSNNPERYGHANISGPKKKRATRDQSSINVPAAPDEDAEAAKALTDQEKRALEALVDPDNWGRPMSEIADRLGMQRTDFARLRRRNRFQDALRGALRQRALARAPQIVDAVAKSALVLGRDGHQDRKLLLQLAGILDDRGRTANLADANASKALDLAKTLADAQSRAERHRAEVQENGRTYTMDEAEWTEEPADQGDEG